MVEVISFDHFHNITIEEQEALRITLVVINGLKAALETGLIHRDIKPGNILFNKAGHVKVVDFGLAQMTNKDPAQVVENEIWATPYYVPPETLDGREEDFRSDIYSLGATMYHALTGAPSIAKDCTSTRKVREAKADITPLSIKAPWLSKETTYLIDRAMALNPANRFNSYDQMAEACQDALNTFTTHPSNNSEPQITTSNIQLEDNVRKRKSPQSTILKILIGISLILAALIAYPLISGKDNRYQNKNITKVNPHQPAEVKAKKTEAIQQSQIAYQLLNDDKFKEDSNKFNNLMQSDSSAWFGIESIIASQLSGNPELAALRIKEFLNNPITDDSFLHQSISQLVSYEDIISYEINDPEISTPYYMVTALAHWERGNPEKAIPLFTKITTLNLIENNPHTVYQKISKRYLADHQLISPYYKTLPSSDINQARNTLIHIKKILPMLQTNGRAKYNTRMWQLRLHRQIKSLLNNN